MTDQLKPIDDTSSPPPTKAATTKKNPHLGILAVGLSIAFLITAGMVIFSVSNYSELLTRYDVLNTELLATRQALVESENKIEVTPPEEKPATATREASYNEGQQLIFNETDATDPKVTTLAAHVLQEFFVSRTQQEMTAYIRYSRNQPTNLNERTEDVAVTSLAVQPDQNGYVLVQIGDIPLEETEPTNFYYQIIIKSGKETFYGPVGTFDR